MKVCPVNENSVIVYFDQKVSFDVADKISHVYRLLRSEPVILDIIPSYTSILLQIDLRKTKLRGFIQRLQDFLDRIDNQNNSSESVKHITLPVYYGEEVALDHKVISEYTQRPFSEIIELHAAEIYRVFAIGFAPGFAYLGNVHPSIAMPRKSEPRKMVPKGSVGIADQQTAIYPHQSPGGWQIIGRTPIELFDIDEPNLSPFEMGAEVRFEAIDRDTFLDMGGQI